MVGVNGKRGRAESVKEHLKPDGVHFMPTGYEAFAAALVECAKKYCEIK